MNYFERIKNYWSYLFEGLLWKRETENPRLLIESTLRDYARKQSETRKSLTSLIFYKKQLESKLLKAVQMLAFYQEKIESFAKNNRDNEALDLMAKLDSLTEEKDFIDQQLLKLNKDIEQAQKMENELKVKMILAREKMEVLSGRMEAMKLRKKLKQNLSQITVGAKNWNVDSKIEKLEKEVFKLELENSEFSQERDLEEGFDDWQINKQREARREKLENLKKSFVKPVDIKQLDYICT
ncbi:MAG: hypothetical protein CME70_03500 [Halobacteriovorax sp.]|nr:hypothetical protein [Halobacteriovorax sp.]|tara:strand:+ start:221859 stop:222575 length:717 start_codon:yes stop_codon:yes gene_type:complete